MLQLCSRANFFGVKLVDLNSFIYLAREDIKFDCFGRVFVDDKEVKVNIFDMAGHPLFYEVQLSYFLSKQLIIIIHTSKVLTFVISHNS